MTNSKPKFLTFFKNRLLLGRLSFFALVLFVVQGCASLVSIDKAQDLFSKGAEIENKQTFNFQNLDPISPASYYNLAYTEVKGAIAADEAKLKQDGILANAYTLKALCEWKLKNYTQARISSDKAYKLFEESESQGIFMPRDKALMGALDGLILTDMVNDSIMLLNQMKALGIDLEKAMRFYTQNISDPDADKEGRMEQAVTIIGENKAKVTNIPAMNNYFLMCQLASMKVWSDGMDYLDNALINNQNAPENLRVSVNQLLDKDNQVYKEKRDALLGALETLFEGQEDQSMYLYWKKLL